jgi:DNA primase
VPLFEFAMRTQIAKYDVTTAEGRVSALNVVSPILANIKDKSLRPEYIKLLAGWLGLDVETVSSAVKRSGTRSNNQEPVAPAPKSEVNLRDPVLMLEREVLKIKLQFPDLATDWANLEKNAFSYWAYHQLRTEIDALDPLDIPTLIEKSQSEDVKSLITELLVEPIRTDREISERYTVSVFARLREVAITRSITELKSTLQRLNPVENEAQYTETFATLVALESAKRAQREIAVGELG